jgi:hypothetical protein
MADSLTANPLTTLCEGGFSVSDGVRTMYKLSFYVPESHLESVKNALFAKGAGHYKAYDQCCWQVRGEGQFRPLVNSQPYLGQDYQLEKVVEYKVEMICTDAVFKEVVQTLFSVHPYEEPAYEVYKILTIEDL